MNSTVPAPSSDLIDSAIDPGEVDLLYGGPHHPSWKMTNWGVLGRCRMEGDSSMFTPLVIQHCVARSHEGTTDCRVMAYQYGNVIVFDFEEPISEFPEEHRKAVEFLRRNGRSVLAAKLITMLLDVKDDPDAPPISLASLWDMAQILTENGDFSDPVIGPDRRGIIHGQWQIIGNGILVVSFLGYGEIILVAQADDTPERGKLDISDRGPEQEILERFGHLVPNRN